MCSHLTTSPTRIGIINFFMVVLGVGPRVSRVLMEFFSPVLFPFPSVLLFLDGSGAQSFLGATQMLCH